MGPAVQSNVKKLRYRTGLKVPFSGIYNVIHKQHRLTHEVTLLKSNTFPRCAKCDKAVQFELIMGIAEPDSFGFRVVLNEIPEIETAELATEAAAAGSEEKAG